MHEHPPALEQKEHLLPATDITIILAPHASRADAAGLRRQLSPDTVFIPELSGWTEHNKQTIQQVANGKLQPLLATYSLNVHPRMLDFVLQLMEEIAETHAHVALIVLPQDHPLHAKLDEVSASIPFCATWSETLQAFTQQTKNYTTLQAEREQYMVEQLLTVLKAHPQSANNAPIKVVITIGEDHEQLVRLLHQQKDKFTSLDIHVQKKAEETTVLGTQSSSYELKLEQLIKTKQPISEELAARALLEKICMFGELGDRLLAQHQDAVQATEAAAAIVKQFSHTQIQELYTTALAALNTELESGSIQVVGDPLSMLDSTISQLLLGAHGKPGLLEQKGIHIPEIEQDDRYYDG